MCRLLLLFVWLAAPAASTGEDEVRLLAKQAATPQAASALVRLTELALAIGDPETAQAATEALPGFGHPGDLALERVLRDAASLPVRARALELCAARRRPEDRGLFLELAIADGPTLLRLLALDVVASDRDAYDLIEPLLRATDVKVQARALRLLGGARFPEALERAREILTPDVRAGPALKIAAIEVLRDDGGPDSIRRLVAVAGRELGEVRDFSLKSLRVMDRGAVLLLLLPMLATTASSDDVLVALDVIAHADAGEIAEIRQAVRDALGHQDPEVQVAAIRALAKLGARDGIAELERAAAGFDPWVAAAAIEAITTLRRDDPAWRDRLLRLVHAPKMALRLAAVNALSALRDPSTVPLLIRLLDDDAWRVREAAVEGLGALRSPAAIEPLIVHLERERKRVRSAIVRALRRTSGMPFRDNVHDWQRWWSDVRANFVVPPLEQVEAMESRLARNLAQGTTRASFYGIPVDSDHLSLVIDISGSMAELDGTSNDPAVTAPGERTAPTTKLDVAKSEVQQLLDHLPDGASINLLFFNDDVQRWQRGLVPLTRSHAARACAFLRERRAAGATNLFDALADALADPQIDTIYLLSDGNPTAGRIVDPMALRTEIRRRNTSRDIRIHVVSIGIESPLLRHLAEDSGGVYVQR